MKVDLHWNIGKDRVCTTKTSLVTHNTSTKVVFAVRVQSSQWFWPSSCSHAVSFFLSWPILPKSHIVLCQRLISIRTAEQIFLVVSLHFILSLVLSEDACDIQVICVLVPCMRVQCVCLQRIAPTYCRSFGHIYDNVEIVVHEHDCIDSLLESSIHPFSHLLQPT